MTAPPRPAHRLGDRCPRWRARRMRACALAALVFAGALAAAGPVAAAGPGPPVSFGYNGEGELGDGTMISRSTPVPVSSLTGVTAIAAGQYRSLALRSDGTVWAFGYNANGQRGDGLRQTGRRPCRWPACTRRPSPQALPPLTRSRSWRRWRRWRRRRARLPTMPLTLALWPDCKPTPFANCAWLVPAPRARSVTLGVQDRRPHEAQPTRQKRDAALRRKPRGGRGNDDRPSRSRAR